MTESELEEKKQEYLKELDFRTIPAEEIAKMNPAERMAAEDEMSFDKLPHHQQINYPLPLWMLEEVLSDEILVIKIPNYVNGRPTKINTLLIKAAIWLSYRNFLELPEMHRILMCFENTCKTLNQPKIPLSE